MPAGPLANAELSVMALLWDHGERPSRTFADVPLNGLPFPTLSPTDPSGGSFGRQPPGVPSNRAKAAAAVRVIRHATPAGVARALPAASMIPVPSRFSRIA